MAETRKAEGVAFEVPEGVDVPRGVPTGDQHPRADRSEGMTVAVEGQREDQGARTSGQKLEAALYESKEKQGGQSLSDTAASLGGGGAIRRETELAGSDHRPYEGQLRGGVRVDTEAPDASEDRDLPSNPGAVERIAESTEGSS